jgi:hypothetical protein
LKNIIGLLIMVGIFLSGCADNDTTNWKVSSTFTDGNMKLYGTEGKFGIIKANGESGEPEFPVGKGRLYNIYFLKSAEDFKGKRYKMVATHKDSGETVDLYEWEIENNQSGAKFVLDKEGLWKINVSVDGKPYTSFIVESK